MALNIDDPEAGRLAEALARHTGETPAQAALTALREKLAREEEKAAEVKRMVEGAMAIGRHFSSLPVIDPRTPDEIIGYDENGLPT
jgi:antitoxin VapB